MDIGRAAGKYIKMRRLRRATGCVRCTRNAVAAFAVPSRKQRLLE